MMDIRILWHYFIICAPAVMLFSLSSEKELMLFPQKISTSTTSFLIVRGETKAFSKRQITIKECFPLYSPSTYHSLSHYSREEQWKVKCLEIVFCCLCESINQLSQAMTLMLVLLKEAWQTFFFSDVRDGWAIFTGMTDVQSWKTVFSSQNTCSVLVYFYSHQLRRTRKSCSFL